MPEATPTRYDRVRYPSKAYSYAHPDRMHVMARLFGLDPTPVETSRILELGCGEGGHLIPMAAHLPGAELVGLDLAATAVDAARAEIARLGLTNVDVSQADVAALPPGLGRFDYILAHGVFSWIPEAARHAMLEACRELLTPDGVLYVSYNVYPGWHLHGVARDLMRLHAERFDDPEEQIGQSVAVLRAFAEGLAPLDTPYAQLLQREHKLMLEHTEGYVFHDFLAPTNSPMLFRDFVGMARAHGLAYLGDVSLGQMMTTGLPEPLRELVEGLSGDVVELEQYMDFVRGTGFRRSLLVRDDRAIQRRIQSVDLADLRVVMRGKPKVTEVDLTTDQPVEFETQEGLVVGVGSRVGKAALLRLGTLFPTEVPIGELCDLALAWLGDGQDRDQALVELGGTLVRGFGANLVDLVPRDRGFVSEVSERPVADPTARAALRRGAERVVNLRHELVVVGRFDRVLLELCDGTARVGDLVEGCVRAVLDGRLTVKLDGVASEEPEVVRDIMERSVPTQLRRLAMCALLVG